MSRYHSYLNSAKQILQQYNGEEPFASFLKKYFSANKKFGSKDRKQVSHLCYCFFRLGKTASPQPLSFGKGLEDEILTALFLCSSEPNEILSAWKPEWNEKIRLPLHKKLSLINYTFLIEEVFPWKGELSVDFDHEKFCESFFIQPDLFLRLRPGKEKAVRQKLERAGITFKILSDSCLALPNASKIEDIIILDEEAAVQDYNSQEIGKFIKYSIDNIKSKITLWDCCAASGGKSIMAYDINPGIELTVSDVRESILTNLKKRFAKAGIGKYKSFVMDLTLDSRLIAHDYDIILADVPCTGSGTWSRTPEQLYFFDERNVGEYATLQRKIISNVIPHLKPGGTFIYITCSVFKQENEQNVEFIQKNFNLRLQQMELLKGYDNLSAGPLRSEASKTGKADSMFVAVLSS